MAAPGKARMAVAVAQAHQEIQAAGGSAHKITKVLRAFYVLAFSRGYVKAASEVRKLKV